MMDKLGRTWAWIVAVLLGMPVLYVASFGPACWLDWRTSLVGRELTSIAYRPILRLAAASVDDKRLTGTWQTIQWWMELGAGDDMSALIWNDGTFEWVSTLPPPGGWRNETRNLGVMPAGR